MAILYRDIDETAWSSATASPVISKPAGTLQNDLMLMILCTNTSTNVDTTPAEGWTFGQELDSSTDHTVAWLYKFAGASEPSTWTMTDIFNSSEAGMAVVISYQGVDTAAPINASATPANETLGAAGTLAGVSVDPTVTNAMIVAFAGADPGTGTYTADPDTSPAATERFDAKESTGGSLAYLYIQEFQAVNGDPIALDVLNADADTFSKFAIALTTRAALAGAVVLPLDLTPTTSGTATHTPVTYFGAATQALTLSLTTSGRLGAAGQATQALTLASTTQGTRALRAQATQALTAALTTSGTETLLGLATLPLTWDATSAGDISTGGATLYGAATQALTLDLTTSGRRTVYAHPFLDSVDGAWTTQAGGTDLADQLDEHIVSDADYIRSELRPETSACRMKLEPLVNPDHDAWHQIDWRIAKDAAGGNTVDMQVRLYEGGGNVLGAGTLIATRTRSDVSETFTTYHESLSAGEVAAITNYSQLFVEVEATVA